MIDIKNAINHDGCNKFDFGVRGSFFNKCLLKDSIKIQKIIQNTICKIKYHIILKFKVW